MLVMSFGSLRYAYIRMLIQRGLGLIYGVAFLILFYQWSPLLGAQGLLPAPFFLKHAQFFEYPSIFFVYYSDEFAQLLILFGLSFSLLAVLGLSERFGRKVSLIIWLSLWLIYLSFVNVGQIFYGYGWEILLLESGFLALFLGSNQDEPSIWVITLYRWLLFRVIFGAGLIKLRGDECWNSFTCMQYHYQSQPLPNPMSWYFHHTPYWFHKLEGFFTYFVELILPFFYFGPRRVRISSGLFTVLFQILLIFSGNLSWLNYITIVIALSTLDDEFFVGVMKWKSDLIVNMNQGFRDKSIHIRMSRVVFGVVLVLSINPVGNLMSSDQTMNRSFNSLHLVNTYGAFGSVSRKRYEVVISGTSESQIHQNTTWLEYQFKGKPGDLRRVLPVVSPYHWKLDWQMWFAAMSSYRENSWILNLALHLLKGDPQSLSLISVNPFPQAPPKFVRAELFLYEFTDENERIKTENTWKRQKVGDYLEPVSLDMPALIGIAKELGWLE